MILFVIVFYGLIYWIWEFLIRGFLIAHGLIHWRFDISRSWMLAGSGLDVAVLRSCRVNYLE
ncbi:MAG: hypothetical protein KKG76_14105 [Euryarchaeota archaeon]|nr:hypothetical protein [Euryarchaeota archaeon]